MISNVQKKKIVHSYSKVLTDIVCSSDNAEKYLSTIRKICDQLQISKLVVNQLNINEYKRTLNSMKMKVDKNDNFQKFLFTLLNRKYGALVDDIIETVAKNISKKLSKNTIIINSKNEILNHTKETINSIITNLNNSKNIDVEYNIDRRMQDDNIEIISNGKICLLDTKLAIKNALIK